MVVHVKKNEDPAAMAYRKLRDAEERRMPFYMMVCTRDGKQHSLPGRIKSCNGSVLCIDMDRRVRLSVAWKGQAVRCYFRIETKDSKRPEEHFMFTSRILDIRAPDTGLEVDLEAPAALDSSQRRRSVRVRPSPELVGLLELWCDQASDNEPLPLAVLEGCPRIAGAPVQCPLSEEGVEAGTAPAGQVQARTRGEARVQAHSRKREQEAPAPGPEGNLLPCLVNISAGGLRVCIAPDAGAEGEGEPLAHGDRVALRITLHWPGGVSPSQELLLKASVCTRLHPGSLPGGVDVGLEFLFEGKVDVDGTVTWLPVRDGVYRIAQWVNAVYLEEIRKLRSW